MRTCGKIVVGSRYKKYIDCGIHNNLEAANASHSELNYRMTGREIVAEEEELKAEGRKKKKKEGT